MATKEANMIHRDVFLVVSKEEISQFARVVARFYTHDEALACAAALCREIYPWVVIKKTWETEMI